MPETIRALVIDPIQCTVEEAQVPTRNLLAAIYHHVQANPVAVAHLDDGNVVYVDDEGMLKTPTHYFQIRGYQQPLAGRGLIFGPVDDDGNETECTIPLAEARRMVRFYS